ncbi:MAG: CDP-glucose 4,6-dehydratase [Butyrivibrio sp.]|nr:CDP-glucose 4,6-dehydratase [Acetatifactor muris]MCM1558267.1 CDP-glucose 4,6-dehydratase [Butyrivibrio sp.]
MTNSFYQGKKVLVTGHTGFKGTWMCAVLLELGAEVTGYALEPPTRPGLFELTGMEQKVHSVEGDVRDLPHLKSVFDRARPEIVIHMAAQPIVRESYKNPVYTYDVNVMGTVNVLECVRMCDSVKSFLNVTTDKVYKNREWDWGYRENEELNGFDPYSNSKSCSELITESYRNSFFGDGQTAISTARAGNVIGGGDFAADRVIPDCVRAIEEGRPVTLRNPQSVRPYQHVLEPVFAYLCIAERQYGDLSLAGAYNVGPEESSCITTEKLVQTFCEYWNGSADENRSRLLWRCEPEAGPHEAGFLKLDCSKIRSRLGWKPRWTYREMLEKTAEWTRGYMQGADVAEIMKRQIAEYMRQ